jgi:hypothetical protein
MGDSREEIIAAAARKAERAACIGVLEAQADYEKRQAHELGRQRGRSVDVQRHLEAAKNLKEAARIVAGDARYRDRQESKAKASGKPACRVCGCTEARACDVGGRGCHWVEPDLCSACAGTEVRRG